MAEIAWNRALDESNVSAPLVAASSRLTLTLMLSPEDPMMLGPVDAAAVAPEALPPAQEHVDPLEVAVELVDIIAGLPDLLTLLPPRAEPVTDGDAVLDEELPLVAQSHADELEMYGKL